MEVSTEWWVRRCLKFRKPHTKHFTGVNPPSPYLTAPEYPSVLAMVFDDHENDWDVHLPHVEYAYT